MVAAPARRPFCVPLARHQLEPLAQIGSGLALTHPALLHGVKTASLDGVGGIAGSGQAHLWVTAQRHAPFFAVLAVLPEPPLEAARADFQIQATRVGQSLALFVWWTGDFLASGAVSMVQLLQAVGEQQEMGFYRGGWGNKTPVPLRLRQLFPRLFPRFKGLAMCLVGLSAQLLTRSPNGKPANCFRLAGSVLSNGRCERIRTFYPLHPMQVK